LAHLSGSKKWKAVRIMALRGWVKCSDGRLYHKTVAEKVAQSWNSRLDSRARTEAARSAKARKKHESPNSPPSAVESVTDTDAELVTSSKGTEQKGTEQNNIERGKEEPPIIPQTTPAQQPVAKAPKNKPRSQLPVNWVPNADGLKLAKSLGLPDETILRFTDYHRSKGSLMADWNAAWGTWCRSPYNKPGASKISSAEANNRRIAELHAELMGDQPPPPADMFAGQTVEGDFAYV
jgi:hypothetical protein